MKKIALLALIMLSITAYATWRYTMTDMYDDPACKVYDEEKFKSIMARYDSHYTASEHDRKTGIAIIKAPFVIDDNAELVLDLWPNSQEYAYHGTFAEKVKFVMPPIRHERSYAEAPVFMKLINREKKTICSWANEALKVPNLKGGNKFIFNLVHPYDETLNSFTIEHLP